MTASHKLKKEDFIDILRRNENLSHIKDLDSLLDRVLSEARAITLAEAGSIFLIKGNKLSFEYVQNDILMQNNIANSNRFLYVKQEMPINNHSIAGYVALNKKHLRLDDVYSLPKNVPYTFNRSFDDSSSYHTKSVLTVPLLTSRENIIGVLQIINAKNEEGQIIPFSKEEEHLVALFASQAALAIERAQMTREVILRMVKLAELRDPKETSQHVQRVASYSIELYQRWAQKKGIHDSQIKRVKDILRIASMLHDVGKVAIPDAILKKKDRLDDNELSIMKLHTIHGADLFKDSNSDWDDMAAEIALNHHERWDGTGYPGYYTRSGENISLPEPGRNGKKGEEIPFTARIVSLVDVYDALLSKRVYKAAWSDTEVLNYIKQERGKQFDPEMVDAFFDIYDTIEAIGKKYTN